MFTASFYDSTGRIIGVMRGPRESVEATSEVTGDPFVEGASNPDLHYVRDGAIVDRPESPAILSQHTLSALPVPCTITVGKATYSCIDTVAELSFEHVGKFQVTIEAWPYLNKEFIVENPPL